MSTYAHAHTPRLRTGRAPVAGARRTAIAASVCLCMAVLPSAFRASPAGAIVATVGGHGYGVTPMRGVNPMSIAGAYRAPSSLGRSPAPGTHRFDEAPNGGGALIDEGGPVMESNTTHVIYWDPNKEFTAATRGVVNKFFTDVAHDSGKATNVFAVDAQYGSAYKSTYAGEATDSDAYPSSGDCTVPVEADAGPPYTTCLYDSQLQSELSEYITAHSLPTGPTQLYFLLLPHKVVTCFEGGTECSNNVFCAYHSYINPGEAGEIIYADIPFSLLDAGDAKGCQADGNPAIQTPNGDIAGTDSSTRFADVAVKYISHEYSEAITDPLVGVKTAWIDSKGLEIGDKCNAWNPGPGTESGEDTHAFLPTLGGSAEAGTLFDQSIDADHYYLQSEWDNATSTCLMLPALIATFSPSASAHVSAPVSFESSTVDPYGELSLEWSFGDGATATGPSPSHVYAAPGIYTVTMTATDALTGTMKPVAHNVVVNDVPSASFTATPDPASVGAAVGFNGVASSDPDGSISSYAWDFGDGATGSGAMPSHAYASPGAYTVKLTVTDVAGETSSISHVLEVTIAGEVAGGEGAGAGSGKAGGTPGAGGGTGAGASGGATSAGTTSAGASAASSSPTSRFTVLAKPSVNARTGAVTYRLSVQDPGTLSLALTFKNGRFGLFSASTRCRPGEAKLNGRCAPAQVIFARSSRAVPAPGVVTLTLRPSAAAAKALENALREQVALPVAATVSFQSALGGPPAVQTQPLSVKLASARRPHATRG
jgi:PKD repeat protein